MEKRERPSLMMTLSHPPHERTGSIRVCKNLDVPSLLVRMVAFEPAERAAAYSILFFLSGIIRLHTHGPSLIHESLPSSLHPCHTIHADRSNRVSEPSKHPSIHPSIHLSYPARTRPDISQSPRRRRKKKAPHEHLQREKGKRPPPQTPP